jgi:exopolyphosphatase/guanosine-5'-triphosphate,3'-diphosphate pyrophosphatase
MVTEFAERKFRLSSGHDFTQDIISTSKNMARRYEVNMEHVDNVSYLANEIFDSIRKLHGLGKRERLLLQIAVILHSCGAYVNMSQTRENSYKIIMSTEIIGISHRERVMVANIVRYNSEQFPPYEKIEDEISREEYITVVKLCAILKLANVMDKSNTQKIKKVRVTLKENSLLIVAHTLADITLEKGLFYRKADVFEEVFGIRPVLKKRK